MRVRNAAVHGQRLAVDLVRPPGVVAQARHRLREVHAHAVGVQHAGVNGLERGEDLGIALDQIGQLQQQLSADGARGGLPGPIGCGRGVDRLVDVLGAGGGDGAQSLAGGGVLDRQGLGRD